MLLDFLERHDFDRYFKCIIALYGDFLKFFGPVSLGKVFNLGINPQSSICFLTR